MYGFVIIFISKMPKCTQPDCLFESENEGELIVHSMYHLNFSFTSCYKCAFRSASYFEWEQHACVGIESNMKRLRVQ